MRSYANKHRRQVDYQTREWVLLKLQLNCMKYLDRKSNEKLCPRFYGPYQIIEKVGLVAYKLRLPEQWNSPTLHPNLQPEPLPPTLSTEQELLLQPEKIMDSRFNASGDRAVFVKWADLLEWESTLEQAACIDGAFPHFHLEDKVFSRVGDLVGIKYFPAEPLKQQQEGKTLKCCHDEIHLLSVVAVLVA
ncbi:hypothetical protein CR513_31539, partial [Mucuna pruriens]